MNIEKRKKHLIAIILIVFAITFVSSYFIRWEKAPAEECCDIPTIEYRGFPFAVEKTSCGGFAGRCFTEKNEYAFGYNAIVYALIAAIVMKIFGINKILENKEKENK